MTVNELLCEVSAEDKIILVKIGAAKKRKNNPKKSKTTKMNSFIDVFGGMVGTPAPGSDGSVDPSAGSSY